MNRTHHSLITELARDISPVRAVRQRDGLLLVSAAIVATVLGVALFDGLWRGPVEGRASPFFFVANGMLGVFGIACASAVVRMASPGVGNRYSGAYWTLAMLAVLPAAVLPGLLFTGSLTDTLSDPYGLGCALSGLAAAALTAATLILWLRRGAPVDPARAGLLAGLASGALGSAAYGLACPIETIGHLALWHMAPVVAAGAIGRYVLVRTLQW